MASHPAQGSASEVWGPPGALRVKWFYLACGLLTFALSIAAHAMGPKRGVAFVLLSAPITLTGWGLALAWLHTTWSEVPTDRRGDITPGGAIGKLFIPFYNLYWMFSVSGALCDVLNLALARVDRPSRVSKGITVSACVLGLFGNVGMIPDLAVVAPYVAVAVHLFWFTHMRQADGARIELAEPRPQLW
jgi:hypothetical protein